MNLNKIEHLTLQYINEVNNNKLHILKDICKLVNLPIRLITDNENVFHILFNFLEKNKIEHIFKNIVKRHCHVEGSLKSDHHMESLRTHLILSMLYTLNNLPKTMSDKVKFYYVFLALFHDCGKPATVYKLHNKYLAYPTHAIYGALFMARMWCKEFKSDISKKRWEELCNIISLHMCSYFYTEDVNYKKRFDILNISADKSIKKGLYYLSFGDKLGIISPDKSINISNEKSFYKKVMMSDSTIKTVMDDNNLKDIIIYIYGEHNETVQLKIIKILLKNGIPKSDIGLNINDNKKIIITTSLKGNLNDSCKYKLRVMIYINDGPPKTDLLNNRLVSEIAKYDPHTLNPHFQLYCSFNNGSNIGLKSLYAFINKIIF